VFLEVIDHEEVTSKVYTYAATKGEGNKKHARLKIGAFLRADHTGYCC
jgi:hypothetical protein